MRKDVLEVLQQYKSEILQDISEFTEPDWWHYLSDVAINVHDWEGTGNVHVCLYDWFEEGGVVDMQKSYVFGLEEFKKL